MLFNSCAPSKPTEKVRLMSADRLIKRLEANRRKVKTFNGNGSLMINSQSVNAKSSFEVMIKKPDSIKVSFFGPFGIDLAQVLITQNYSSSSISLITQCTRVKCGKIL